MKRIASILLLLLATTVLVAPTASAADSGGDKRHSDVGRLGDGQFIHSPLPVTAAAGQSNVTSVWTSHWGSCETTTTGRVWCWGNGLGGRLGNGSGTDATSGEGVSPGNSFGFAETPSKVAILNSAPGKPAGSSPAKKKITISWAAPSISNGTSAPKDYVIQYRVKGTSAWKTFKDSVTTSRTVTVTGLTSGGYYQFRVLPKNWAGTGTASAVSANIRAR